MAEIITFGEILLRLASPGYTKLFQKDTLETSFCGGEANVAVSLAKFGLEVSFLTKLPNNDIADAAVNTLKYFGVDTSKIVYGSGRMGLYYLEKGASQRPSKVIYDREYSAIAMAMKSDFDWESIFEGVKWFHWTGINPALSDELAEICEEACIEAKKRGIVISCDLNYRSSLWDQGKAFSIMSKLMNYVDVCIGNEEDAEKVLGIKSENTDVESGKLNREGYIDVARQICKMYGCKKVAITLRESISASYNRWSGMFYSNLKDEAFFSKVYDIQIVDRVGGGDSFTAAIIYGLFLDKKSQYVVDFAAAASCLKHTMEGDFNRVSINDVESLLSSGGNGRVKR